MKKKIDEKDMFIEQIEEAKLALQIAEQNEELADPEFLEVAIEQVNIARSHLNTLYKQAKLIFA